MRKVTLVVYEAWGVGGDTWPLGAQTKQSSEKSDQMVGVMCMTFAAVRDPCRLYDMRKHTEIGTLFQQEGIRVRSVIDKY